jgi:hypothetical protein
MSTACQVSVVLCGLLIATASDDLLVQETSWNDQVQPGEKTKDRIL